MVGLVMSTVGDGQLLCIGGPLAGKRLRPESDRVLIPTVEAPSPAPITDDTPAGYYDKGGVWRWGFPLNHRTHVYEIERVLMYRGET